MHFEIWRSWSRLAFLEPHAWGYGFLALESLLTLAFLARTRRDFFALDRRGWLLLLGCLTAPLLSERLLVVVFSGRDLLPPPGVPLAPAQPFAPLFGMLPVAVAGAWLGPGPALLVGLAKGLLRASMSTGSLIEPLHLGLLGFLVGFLLRQDYRGRLPSLARQPIMALPVAIPFAALLLLVSRFLHVAESGLSGLDYAVALTRYYACALLLEGVVAALAIQGLYLLLPRIRPVRAAGRWPPYSRTLNRRLLVLFVPLIALITIVLVSAVTTAALRLATSEAVKQMARDANDAGEDIPHFLQTGQGLLTELANDEDLWATDAGVLEDRLRRGMQMVVFFDQLLLLDSSGQALAEYPPRSAHHPQLTAQEQVLLERVFETGAPQASSVHRSRQGAVMLTFAAPIVGPSAAALDGAVSRMLVGRTCLDANPVIERIVDGLQWLDAQRTGFIVDSQGHIVAHPDADMLLRTWEIDDEPSRIPSSLPGWAYESRDPQDNTRQLVYYAPVDGYPWSVIVHLPYAVVLEQAGRIAAPLLALQVLLGGGLIVIISLVTSWVTRPLQDLAGAADRIAKGDLYHQVDISGQDEVARVGDAFETMRMRLKDRMEALSLLLQVSRAVSATLELAEGMPFILEGALKGMDAQIARIVFLRPDGEPEETLSRGEPWRGLGHLDRALAHAVHSRGRPLVIGDLKRAGSLFEHGAAGGMVRSVVALPIQSKEQLSAVMWVGYDAPRQLDDSDVDLLSTLASQTSVLVENARLFESAEGERRRLSAILSSTTDAVVVTDQHDRVLLINPAAERAFDVARETVSGRSMSQVQLPRALLDVLEEPLDVGEALTRELSLADGRTLYANVSAITSGDTQRLGRVAVMRDITHLKELDELKSEFVSTVSHDLRSPLTIVRGYATMLQTAGTLTADQEGYVGKILRGVRQISDLVDDLLDLRRIEAGVGLEGQPCHLNVLLSEAVDARQMRAATEDIALRLELRAQDQSPGHVIVSGDPALLRQAVTNLVDNAIKYTPNGGQVVVSLSIADSTRARSGGSERRALIRVSDTGIGIAAEDQVRLFEKFYRVRRQDVPSVSGTGLGLSLVKSIVERHHGKVWVESELNRGSVFTISLPLVERGSRVEGEVSD